MEAGPSPLSSENPPMPTGSTPTTAVPPACALIALRHPQLQLLALHGSRANGTAHPQSDWDFAFLADEGLDVAQLQLDLVTALRTESVDLADLNRASAVLRLQVATHGVVCWERDDAWFRFKLEAADFWCDAGPVIKAAQRDFVAGVVAKAMG